MFDENIFEKTDEAAVEAIGDPAAEANLRAIWAGHLNNEQQRADDELKDKHPLESAMKPKHPAERWDERLLVDGYLSKKEAS